MIIGIDPGKSGSIVVVSDCKTDVDILKFQNATVTDVWRFLAKFEGLAAVIESVHATPQMGVTSAFKFGKCSGMIDAAVVAAGVRPHYVSPQRWQRKLGLISKGRTIGIGDTEKKNKNKTRAQELFPAIKVTHAIADALLLAHYGQTFVYLGEVA